MTKTEAKQALARLLVKKLGIAGAKTTFKGFAEQRWKVLHEGKWRESTQATNEELLEIIFERFGDIPIADVDSVMLSSWLNETAKKRSVLRGTQAKEYRPESMMARIFSAMAI